jgi:transposase-like protein
MNLLELAQMTEDQARAHLEGIRWPDGPVCPRCGEREKVYRLKGKSTRAGLLKCGGCRKPFSVTVGTVMEASHVPIQKWLLGFHLMASSKKGVSAHQLSRNLGVTLKTAWFLSHRIRFAMEEPRGLLTGDMEADETFVGGKPRRPQGVRKPEKFPAPRTPMSTRRRPKMPVAVLVQRDGKAIAEAIQAVKAPHMRDFIERHVDLDESKLFTDESTAYVTIGRRFAHGHETVAHGKFEYVRGEAHINTAESFFALLKRAHYGVHHWFSKRHLPRYVAEREFMWNARKMDDPERRDRAIKGIEGKRLTYRDSSPATAT